MPAANKLLIPLLVLAHVCVHAVLLALCLNGTVEKADMARGLLFAEVPLVTMWFAWGRSSLVLRMAGLGATISVGGVFLAVYDPDQPRLLIHRHEHQTTELISSAMGAMLYLALLTGVPLVITRFAGAVACHAGELEAYNRRQEERRRWQFSMWQLFSVMTLVALALPLLMSASFVWLRDQAAAAQGVVFVVSALCCALAVLLPKRWEVSLGFAAVVLLAEFVFHDGISDLTRPETSGWLLVLAQVTAVCSSTAVVRLAGYRIWPWAATASGLPCT